ncbi:MAG TPA: serine/threonine-protein kinase [Planctomycetaceae bacterium]|nr:serine/threonine-protein kinase [Planctomycetaceae bacterium]
MNESNTPSERVCEDRDERLSDLVEQALGAIHRGEEPNLADLTKGHPDLEQELRELLATARLAEELGQATDPETMVTVSRATQFNEPPSAVGDYKLLEELGRGGMGIVYKARQQTLGREVALKMLLIGAAAGQQERARFRQEAEAAARLDHSAIVPVHEVGEYEGQMYFSMKYISGTNLAKRLQTGPLEPIEAVKLMIPICQGVAEAHRHDILHRDLKPSNILIDEQGKPYITDFGLAKQLSSIGDPLTETGAIIGTPGYLSPEQASAGQLEVGKSSDVYSLGAILYSLLTGRPPFQGVTPVQTILMVSEQEAVPPRALNPNVDPDLQLIVMKCLQKPQDLRYRSVNDLERDLQAWLDHDPISARSSRFRDVLNRAFRESQHAVVLESWGLLWMWHALVLLGLCVATNVLQLTGVVSRIPYVLLWTIGLGFWAGIFWNLRRRSGPITSIERQVAHVWAGSIAASSCLFAVEAVLELPVLSLSPVLGLISGTVFMAKAGMLSGQFYLQSGALFLVGIVMAWIPQTELPQLGILLFGVVSAICFFVPGWQYHRQRIRRLR